MTDDPRLAVALNGYGLERSEPDGFHRDVLAWDEVASAATLAERLGYRTLFMPQQDAWEPTTALAAIAGRTSSIGLATGVLPLGARDPHEVVLSALSVQALSGGRFVLGLGSDLSLTATRERVVAIRDALRGEEGYLTDAEMVLGPPDLAAAAPIAVFLAALGPRMVRLAAEVADGVILNWCTPERVAAARAEVGHRDGFAIAVYVRACLSHVDEHAVEALKTTAARYVFADHYARQFEAMGLGEEVRLARAGLEGGGHPRDVVADALVDGTCVRGDRQAARTRLAEYRDAGADLVVVYPVPAGEAVSSISGTLMAVAPDPSVEA